jgi:uncharacterized surface protein with fasciclin (FAS1) repeats
MSKRILLIIGCVLALGVGVAACGDDDEDATSGATNSATATEEQSSASTESTGNIVAVAKATPELSTLVEAVSAAGLVKTLEGPGPFTVFAPTNQAFEGLGSTLNTLLKPANKEELAGILTYHVVPGELKAADLSNGQKLKTVQGDQLTVKVADGEVTVNGAKVAMPDVAASNGVVHVIDEVLVPPEQ